MPTRLGSLRSAIAVVTGISTLHMGLAIFGGLIVTQLEPLSP